MCVEYMRWGITACLLIPLEFIIRPAAARFGGTHALRCRPSH
eukprot:SAG22_NODE_221_length_14781_cov_82.531490_16_plen_42_part_00